MGNKPKKAGYWDNIKNIQKHLKKIIKKNKAFPSKEELRAFPYGMEIETAIMRLGMTLDEFRVQMGVKAPHADEQDHMLDLLMNSTESFLDTVREQKKARQNQGIETIAPSQPAQIQQPTDSMGQSVPPADSNPIEIKKKVDLKDSLSMFENRLKKYEEKD